MNCKVQEAEMRLRAALVARGVLTTEEITAVRLLPADPKNFPNIPRCECEACKQDSAFIALALDTDRLSKEQISGVAAVFNDIARPNLPAPSDPKKWNGGQRLM